MRKKTLLKTIFSNLDHWSRSNQGKQGIRPIITAAIDKCNRVKMGHLVSHEWHLFPQKWFWCFKVECLVVSSIKKISGNNKASWKASRLSDRFSIFSPPEYYLSLSHFYHNILTFSPQMTTWNMFHQ